MSAEWIDAMRRARVLDVAKAFGIAARAPGRLIRNGSVYGCPACNAQLRHTKREDKRGAVGVHESGRGWACFQCSVSGDTIDFVAFKLRGSRYRDLAPHAREDVRAWCCDYTHTMPAATVAQEPIPEPEPRAPMYPSSDDVSALWAACIRTDEDPAVASYLRGRALSPTAIADLDLARALPRDADVPDWARGWQHSGHRLIVPMYDATATMRSALARAIAPNERKSLAPRGFQRAGLSMQCPFARLIVREGVYPEWWPESRDLRVIVAEGEIDFVTWVTEFSESAECAPATIGITEGSWTPALAARVPDRSVVLVATHHDAPGEKYCERIVTTFAERDVQLERWSPDSL